MTPRSAFSSLMRAWDKFFFEPTSPASLGLFRIALGIVAFLSVLGKYPYRGIFYGQNAVISNETMNAYIPDSLLYFRWIPQNEPWLNLYFLIFLVAILSLILGYKSRLSCILVFLGLISLSNRNLFVDNSGDQLLRINFFFLMFAPSGAAYSLDRWLLSRKGLVSENLTPISPWVQRLLQMQLAYLYFETAYTKSGDTWKDGTAIYYALNYLEIRRFDITWFFDSMLKIKLTTYGTLALEFAIPFLIWFKPFRYPLLLGAVALHTTFNIIMQFPVFQFVMLASLINFLYPKDVEKIIGYISRKRSG